MTTPTAPHLPPEQECGSNAEYKLHLARLTPALREKRTSQLAWRLGEGCGEAHYLLGYSDDGTPTGIVPTKLDTSLAALAALATRIGAAVWVVHRMRGKLEGSLCAHVVVRLVATRMRALHIALAGNVDVGKSTLTGCLARGGLDNGRGLARSAGFNHVHELTSGRTSSIGSALIGFDAEGAIVNYPAAGEPGPVLSTAEVAAKAAKLIQLQDLCGHEKYLKTTVAGLARSPDYALVVVGANAGVQRMTREHLGLAFAMRIPVVFVVTKCDTVTPDNVRKETLQELKKVARAAGRRMLFPVKSVEDASQAARMIGGTYIVTGSTADWAEASPVEQDTAVPATVPATDETAAVPKAAHLHTPTEAPSSAAAGSLGTASGSTTAGTGVGAAKHSHHRHSHSDHIIPVFQVSCVTGLGLDKLRTFLNLLPARGDWISRVSEPAHVIIDANYSVTGVGTVAGGMVLRGTVRTGDTMWLGPDSNGRWQQVPVKSLHVHRMPTGEAFAGQVVGVALKKIKRNLLRRGMSMLAKETQPVSVMQFDADIVVLSSHATTIKPGYQPVVQVGVVRQSAAVQALARPLMRAGDRGRVRLRFIRRPEYLQVGDRLVFREGRCRGVGIIRAVYDMHTSPEPPPLG